MTEKRHLTRAQILQELDRLPDEILVQVWESAISFSTKSEDRSGSLSRYSCSQIIIPYNTSVQESSNLDSTQSSEENSEIDRQAWQAYLDSERERKGVYRRLANS